MSALSFRTLQASSVMLLFIIIFYWFIISVGSSINLFFLREIEINKKFLNKNLKSQ